MLAIALPNGMVILKASMAGCADKKISMPLNDNHKMVRTYDVNKEMNEIAMPQYIEKK